MYKIKTVGCFFLSIFLIFSTVAMPVAAVSGTGDVHFQQENSTVTTSTSTGTPTAVPTETPTETPTSTNTPAPEVCQPSSDEPSLTQSRLYAPEKELTGGEPGKISGGFRTDATATCPIRVSITMQVPSGMQIEGASDIMSGGAGIVGAEFTVKPGNIKSIRASVFSENTGSRTVTADIQYWPVGHPDMAKEIDGISMTFDVKEPVTPSSDESQNSNGTQDTALDGFGLTTALIGAIVLLLLVAIVGLIAR